jgi:hypothetical protein
VAKPNYHHARKQKELARKSRQLQKEQRRSARVKTPGTGGPEDADVTTDTGGTPGASGG